LTLPYKTTGTYDHFDDPWPPVGETPIVGYQSPWHLDAAM
jgi:hypothetical protein